jgi:hypothetical protein
MMGPIFNRSDAESAMNARRTFLAIVSVVALALGDFGFLVGV